MLEDSSKLQQVRDLVVQIREELRPLARLDGTSQKFLLQFFQDFSTHALHLGGEKADIYIGAPEILNVAKDVRETLVEFQTQVVQALCKLNIIPGPKRRADCYEPCKETQQRKMLSSKLLDSELQELKAKYLAESQYADTFHPNLYVPAQGMETQYAPEGENFDLWGRLEWFMAPELPQRVCLILGAAGSGKSTFNHYLATRL